ncbi:MAG: HAMP domain-containing sensor histidine kinase [Vallitaleaceae bacterium]|jgi:histidine kinase|nr:HAMP domain-containing sensor histidine kinase [Vallitaleaceae bacterium]
MSIRIKLVLSYLILVVMAVVTSYFTSIAIVGIVIDTFIKAMPGVERNEDIHDVLEDWADIYVDVAYLSKHQPDIFKDESYLEELNTRLTDLEIGYCISIDGEITFLSDYIVTEDIMKKVQLMDLTIALNSNQDMSNILDYGNRSFFVVDSELAFSDQTTGKYYALIDVTNIQDVSQDSIRGVFTFGAFLTLLLFIGLLLIINKMIIRPLKELDKGTKRIREGNLEEDVPIRKNDEIGKISQAFNTMRRELKASIDKQVAYEENRKELISSISHDLKTPITSIKGYVEGIRDGVADTQDKQDKYLDVIYTKSRDMDRLIDDLFLFSKLDLHRLPFDMKCIDAKSFFKDCIEEISFDIEKRGIIFTSSIQMPSGTRIYVDHMNLKRVILNVVQNAIKYMDKQEQSIDFSVVGYGDFIKISVKDNGKGIEDADINSIFDKFYRADKSRNTEVSGSGLGLAIAKQIIDNLGGDIWATSEYGKGSTIEFTLIKCDDKELTDGTEETDINN